MPIYTSDDIRTGRAPWVRVDGFQLVTLDRTRASTPSSAGNVPYWGTITDTPAARSVSIRPTRPRERIVMLGGEATVETESGRVTLQRRDWIDVPPAGITITNLGYSWAEFAHIAGDWDETVRTEICAFSPEFPCEIHYHDGEEYWFVYRGHFTAEIDGERADLQPGSILAAPAGVEHGATDPGEYFEAVVLATGLRGQGRDGHLTREKHGIPAPLPFPVAGS